MKISIVALAACMMTLSFSFLSTPSSAAVEGWEDPIMVQANIDYTQCETLAMDDQGNALVVWEQPWGNISEPAVWARQYNRVLGWAEPVKIFENEMWCGYTTMSMSSNGRAIAAWGTSDITLQSAQLYARFFDPISGWGETYIIAEDQPGIGDIVVAISNYGDAVYIWKDPWTMYMRMYDHETGWGEAEMMDPSISEPVIHYDDLGNALMLWNNENLQTIESAWYAPGEGWGEVATVSSTSGDYVTFSFNDDGGVMAAWRYFDGVSRTVSASLFTPSDGWSEPQIIAPVEGGTYPISINIDAGAEGEFFAAWEQDDAVTGDGSVWVRRWTDDSGWEEAVKISGDGHQYYYMWPSLAANDEGSAAIIWTEGFQDSTLTDIQISRYKPGIGWSVPEVIDNSDTMNAYLGHIVMDPLGNSIVTWKLDFGQCYLWGAAYKAYWAPDVMIAEPLDGTVVDTSPITVRGFAETDSILTVNGMTVPLEADGSFEVQVDLSSGENLIVARATDDVGNYTETSITVTYGGSTSESPVAVIIATSSHNGKLWRFDARDSRGDGRIVRYLWDFGDGSTSESVVTVHRYHTPGTYLVTLTVWDDDGNSDTASIMISLEPGGDLRAGASRNMV